MLQPTLVTIDSGYRLCGVCGELIGNGETVLFLNDAYAHSKCADRNVPDEWKYARRIDAYNQQLSAKLEGKSDEELLAFWTPKQVEDYWENQLVGIDVPQREQQYPVRRNEDGTEDTEPFEATGMRWNGNVLADARAVLEEADARCDRPLVARLMVEIAEGQILREERIEMFDTMTPAELEADKHEVHHPFVDVADDRTSVGLSYVNGRLVDNLPAEEIFTDEQSDEDGEDQ